MIYDARFTVTVPDSIISKMLLQSHFTLLELELGRPSSLHQKNKLIILFEIFLKVRFLIIVIFSQLTQFKTATRSIQYIAQQIPYESPLVFCKALLANAIQPFLIQMRDSLSFVLWRWMLIHNCMCMTKPVLFPSDNFCC